MPHARHRRGARERRRPNRTARALERKARLNRIRRALASDDIDEIVAMGTTWSEIKEATQTMSRYKDFDAAVSELEPIEFVVKGKKYRLDGDPPVGPVLIMLAEGFFDQVDDDPKLAIEILRGLIGADNVDQMLKDGIGATQLTLLISWLTEQLGFDGTSTEAEVEVELGDEGNGSRSPNALSIGELSRPISGAATG